MIEAKIFNSGNSQAIRLPKEYRMNTGSVLLNRIGNVLVIVPKDDPWSNFREGIKDAEEFPEVTDIRPKVGKIKLK